MARSPAARTILGESPWEPRLTVAPSHPQQGDPLILTVIIAYREGIADISPERHRNFYEECFHYEYSSDDAELSRLLAQHASGRVNPAILPSTHALSAGTYEIRVTITPTENFLEKAHRTLASLDGINRERLQPFPEHYNAHATVTITARPEVVQASVTLQRSASARTDDQALWAAIRNRTAAVGFDRYHRFINHVFREGDPRALRLPMVEGAIGQPQLHVYGPHAYNVLKFATQAFLTLEAGVYISQRHEDHKLFEEEHEPGRFADQNITIRNLTDRLQSYLSADAGPAALPYLNRIVRAFLTLDRDDGDEAPSYFDEVLKHRLTKPSLIELIWSYWQEQGMLVQTMNAIAWRFQNRRAGPNDPLGELEFDTLRPLSNMIWGYIQDEHNRLTVARRASEYRHHYGLTLEGRAVQDLEPADNRSKFIEAFHNLLYRTDRFYREDRDTTMIADAFPLLNALKEVHLILAEGMHNQYGDLTWTARAEMLTMQWMLARPEMREFLRGRYAVPYQEQWMGAVDSMKRLQGWSDTSITHFHELAVTGERLLLSIRFGDWSDIHNIEEQAKNWARNSKPEVQRYMFCYRTVTGVDLTADTTDTSDASRRFLQPSALLRQRLSGQKTPPLIGNARPPRIITAERQPFRARRLVKSSVEK
jgi:hypothetical protein